jgi:hypothetical protein
VARWRFSFGEKRRERDGRDVGNGGRRRGIRHGRVRTRYPRREGGMKVYRRRQK